MTSIYVNRLKAETVFNTAPALGKAYCQIGSHAIRLEGYDYGFYMGWFPAGQDIRARVFIDHQPLPPFTGHIFQNRRPAWLPKGITIKLWNVTLRQLEDSAIPVKNAVNATAIK